MKGQTWFTALAIVLGLLGGPASAWSRNSYTQLPLQEAIPGPGPNRLDRDTTGTYTLSAGDVMNVAFTFRPMTTVENQKIEPADVLAFAYHFAVTPADQPYHVQPGDKIYLNFRYSPDNKGPLPNELANEQSSTLSRIYIVQPGGTLALPGLKAPLEVRGKTTDEIQKVVMEAYQEMLRIPDVVVSVEPMYLYRDALKSMIRSPDGKALLLVPVPADRKIALPLLPEVLTAGKTVQQLGQEVTERYHKLNYPLLTVTVWYEKIADERHQQLRDLLTSNNNPLHCEILPTGEISLPLIPQYRVAGKPIGQIGPELTRLYRQQGLDRVEVNTWMEIPRGRVIRILGEVESPSVYSIHGSADLWGMIALAGGFTPEADTAAVTIKDPKGKRRGPFSLDHYLESGNAEENPILRGDELIYVPRKQ